MMTLYGGSSFISIHTGIPNVDSPKTFRMAIFIAKIDLIISRAYSSLNSSFYKNNKVFVYTIRYLYIQ